MVCMMIVPTSLRSAAAAAANQIDPGSNGQAFSKPLRTIGSVEPTHWYCGPNLIDAPVIDAIRSLSKSPAFFGGVYYECSPENVRDEFLQLLAEHDLEEMPPTETE